MVVVLVLVSKEKPDEVRVTIVPAAESLENFNLPRVFFFPLSTESFDGEVLLRCALDTSNPSAKRAMNDASRSFGKPLLTNCVW